MTNCAGSSHCIAYAAIFHVLEPRRDIPDLTRSQRFTGGQAGVKVTDFQYIRGTACCHHGNALSFAQLPIDDTHVGNDTDRKSTRLNSSHIPLSRMPSSACK